MRKFLQLPQIKSSYLGQNNKQEHKHLENQGIQEQSTAKAKGYEVNLEEIQADDIDKALQTQLQLNLFCPC